MREQTQIPQWKTGAGLLLAACLLLPATANAQRDGVVVAPDPGTIRPVDPAPELEPHRISPYAGTYRLSINDTRGPQDCLTYAVGWMKVGRDGSFVLWARNPEAGGSATVKGEVLRNGQLAFSPPLPNNIRAAVRIKRKGRCVTGLIGKYLVVAPVVDPGDGGDGGDPVDIGAADVAEEEPVLAVVHDRRKRKAGVLIGFRR